MPAGAAYRIVEIAHLIVISPPGLGDERYESLMNHLTPHLDLPRLKRIGISKNRVDFSGSRHGKRFFDDRPRGHVRRLLRDPERIDFAALYDDSFTSESTPHDFKGVRCRYLRSGQFGSSLSHLEALRFVSREAGPCLIVEDDLRIVDICQRKRDFLLRFSLPAGASLVHLVGQEVRITAPYDENFFRIVADPERAPLHNNCNLAYIITPEAARTFLAEKLPLPTDRQIDQYMWNTEFPALIRDSVYTPAVRDFSSEGPSIATPWRHPGLAGLAQRISRTHWLRENALVRFLWEKFLLRFLSV